MAQDPLMSTKAFEIIARDLGLQPSDYGIYTIASGITTLYPGMLVTTFGQADGEVKVLAVDDDWVTGIVLKRNTRKISADGAVSDNIDTVLTAGDEIMVLHKTGGRAYVWLWLMGLTSGDGNGTIRRGAPLYIPSFSATATVVPATLTLGAGYAGLIDGLDLLTGATKWLSQIGIVIEEVAVPVESTTTGVIAKVSW